jgi:hypothetical protein
MPCAHSGGNAAMSGQGIASPPTFPRTQESQGAARQYPSRVRFRHAGGERAHTGRHRQSLERAYTQATRIAKRPNRAIERTHAEARQRISLVRYPRRITLRAAYPTSRAAGIPRRSRCADFRLAPQLPASSASALSASVHGMQPSAPSSRSCRSSGTRHCTRSKNGAKCGTPFEKIERYQHGPVAQPDRAAVS